MEKENEKSETFLGDETTGDGFKFSQVNLKSEMGRQFSPKAQSRYSTLGASIQSKKPLRVGTAKQRRNTKLLKENFHHCTNENIAPDVRQTLMESLKEQEQERKLKR